MRNNAVADCEANEAHHAHNLMAPQEHADDPWPLMDPSRPPSAHDALVIAIELDHRSLDITTLDHHERERAARLQGDVLRHRYLAAHVALRQILGWRLGEDPARLFITADQYGKPALRDHRLAFNLSHSGGWALVALTDDGVVGVDLELGERLREVDQLAARVFSLTELTAFNALPAPQRNAAFLTAWVRKEAALKALGLGLPGGMEHVVIAETPLRLCGDHTRLPGLRGLHLHDLPSFRGGHAALCHGPVVRTVTCCRWPLDRTPVVAQQLPTRLPT